MPCAPAGQKLALLPHVIPRDRARKASDKSLPCAKTWRKRGVESPARLGVAQPSPQAFSDAAGAENYIIYIDIGLAKTGIAAACVSP
jgi:hypothetical protein